MKWFCYEDNELCSHSDRDEFVRYYNGIYYLMSDWSSERKAERLLTEGIKSREDAVTVLCWKFGTKPPGCETEGKIQIKNTYGRTLDVTELVDKMLALAQDNVSDSEIWDTLALMNVKGFGGTYMLNVLYFLTRGRFPIYDKFAAAALKALDNGICPGETVSVQSLPEKGSQAYRSMLNDEHGAYYQYQQRLRHLFGYDDSILRDTDRALWTYGHQFRIAEE